jgi:sulfate adenylyltransferase subunit 1 (EFTu-like GTPase family)
VKKRIAWTAVAQARRNLVAIKRAHPELTGPADIDQWTSILEKDEAMAETQQTAFRLPVDLIERLDKHVKRLQDAAPGMNITRADAVRVLLTRGLDEAEQKPRKSRKGSS